REDDLAVARALERLRKERVGLGALSGAQIDGVEIEREITPPRREPARRFEQFDGLRRIAFDGPAHADGAAGTCFIGAMLERAAGELARLAEADDGALVGRQ